MINNKGPGFDPQPRKTEERLNKPNIGAQRLKGENLRIVWAKFTTLGQAFLVCMQLAE